MEELSVATSVTRRSNPSKENYKPTFIEKKIINEDDARNGTLDNWKANGSCDENVKVKDYFNFYLLSLPQTSLRGPDKSWFQAQ